MRKVFVEVKIQLVINIDEGIEVEEVVNNIDVFSNTDGADIEDKELLEYIVTDSK